MIIPSSLDAPESYDPLPEAKSERSLTTSSFEVERGTPLLAAIFLVLRKQARTALVSAFVLAAVGAGVSKLLKPYYTASSSFVPPSGGTSAGVAAMLGQLASVGGGLGGSLLGGVKSNTDLYSSLLKSHTVAEKVVDHFHLADVYKTKKESATEQTLASNTNVLIGSKDGIVTVKVTDYDPVRARDMANYYLEALREMSFGMALSESSQQRLFFEDRLRREKDALSAAEIALKEDEEKSGLVAPAGQTAQQLQTISQLRLQVVSKETELAALRQSEAEENPDVQRVQGELSSLRAQISQLQSGKRMDAASSLTTAQVPALTLDYVRLQREVKYHETLFEIIAKQYEAARLSEANDPPLQIVDKANTPDTKAGPHGSIIAAVCFVLGFFGVMLWALLRATQRHELDWSQLAG